MNKREIEVLDLIYDMISSIYGRVDNQLKKNINNSAIAEGVATDSDAVVEYISEKIPTIHKIDAILIYHLMFMKYMVRQNTDPMLLKISSGYIDLIEILFDGLNTAAMIVFRKQDMDE